MLERLNEEIRPQTYVVLIFPTQTLVDASFEPLPSKLTRTGSRPTAMNDLKELKKTQFRQAA